MDVFTLKKVEFNEVRRILGGFCSTSLGKALAARINPSRNPETIRQWLTQVSQMVEAIREVSLPPFGGVTDIHASLGRAHPSGGATGEDFAAIASVLEGAANVKAYLNALPERLDSLHPLAEAIGTFDQEVHAIRSVVDADGSIRDDASERLGRIRQEMRTTARQIHDVIYSYVQDGDVSRLLQNPTVTLHGDRYVLPVKAENRGRLPGVVHRASHTGATVFIEPNACVELNNRLSDLHDDERREVERLLNQLAIHVQARADEIAATMRTLAQIDLISAKAQYAYQFDMTSPEVTERGALQFSTARHPLLIEQAHRQAAEGAPPEQRHPVVPIDVRLGSDFDLLVITGSNTGGKTVTLKTVATLVLMAQSGMHVPARRGATMPVFRDVFIDVGDEQSLQQSLSTFGAHIKRIRYVLRKADRASLVLLDELGAGTDPDEGGAIGQAVLDELRSIGCLGMVTTHLSVLKAYAFNHERVDNASVDFDTATLSPTYHLRIGTPGESHAITVSRRLGLPKRIVSAARKHLSHQGRQFRKAIRATGQARQVAEEARAQAQAAEFAARTQQETYEGKLADLHRLQREFETWLATLPELRPGDEVMVPSLNRTGRLVRLELHRQIAVVDTGKVQAEVPLAELMPDLGQAAVREQIAALRQQILNQARETDEIRAEADHARSEYHRSLEQQRQRARQFDAWLGAIARVKVGDEVPIARRPGKGKVVKLDLPGLRATVATGDGEMELSIQDLFPQTGPFSPHAADRTERPARPGGRTRRARAGDKDRPMVRGRTYGRAAKAKREALLALKPGQKVFVVPFHKRATLIRLQPEKDQAVVQSGIFEMQIPLSDIEPLRSDSEDRRKPPSARAAAKDKPPAGKRGKAGERQGERPPESPPETKAPSSQPPQPTAEEPRPAEADTPAEAEKPAEADTPAGEADAPTTAAAAPARQDDTPGPDANAQRNK